MPYLYHIFLYAIPPPLESAVILHISEKSDSCGIKLINGGKKRRHTKVCLKKINNNQPVHKEACPIVLGEYRMAVLDRNISGFQQHLKFKEAKRELLLFT